MAEEIVTSAQASEEIAEGITVGAESPALMPDADAPDQKAADDADDADEDDQEEEEEDSAEEPDDSEKETR